MTPTKPTSRRVMFAVLLLAGLSLVGSSCASGKSAEQPSDRAEEKAAEKKDRTPRAPTPEELAESPCGNPNWAQLPDQHKVDGDPDETSGQNAASTGKDAEEVPQPAKADESDEERETTEKPQPDE